MHLNINRTFVLTTDKRNDSMYDVNLNLVLVQIRSYDTKTQFCFTDHFNFLQRYLSYDTRTLTPILIKESLEDWVSHVKYRI